MQLRALRKVPTKSFKKHELPQMAVPRNVKAGKEPSVDYGRKLLL